MTLKVSQISYHSEKTQAIQCLFTFKQRPELKVAFTEAEWWQKYQRRIKERAYPLIYFNRTPYGLVYDAEDTEGENDLPSEIFTAKDNTFSVDGDLLRRLEKITREINLGIHKIFI